jgi:hypothetical protein
MDRRIGINLGVAALVAALLVAAYIIHWLRLRQTKQRMKESLAEYFNGDLPLDQLARRAREVAGRSFIGGRDCQALVQSAFQRSAERSSQARRILWRSRSSSWPRSRM